MKVYALIELLKRLPAEAEVFQCYDTSCSEDLNISTVPSNIWNASYKDYGPAYDDAVLEAANHNVLSGACADLCNDLVVVL